MALHLDPGGAEPRREPRQERLPGAAHQRRDGRRWEVARGTFACPECDLPVGVGGGLDLGAGVACPFCGTEGSARDFLEIGGPARPARVAVVATLH